MIIKSPEQGLREIGFREREIQKVIAFCSFVSEHLGAIEDLVDLCGGNGLCSLILQYNGLAKRSIIVDKRKPQSFHKLEKLFKIYDLENDYIEEDICLQEQSFRIGRNTTLVAVHACSGLTDRIIQLALENNSPLALMPCCYRAIGQAQTYSLKNPPDSRLMFYKEIADYFDAVRKRYMEEQGRECLITEIPKTITPCNHVLISKPRNI